MTEQQKMKQAAVHQQSFGDAAGSADGKPLDQFINHTLAQMSFIADQLSAYLFANANITDASVRRSQQQEIVMQLHEAWQSVSDACVFSNCTDIQRIAQANLAAIEHGLSDSVLALLEESVAVLPQLIDQLQGNSDRVRGLESLLNDLHRVASAAEAEDNSATVALDNELLQVFHDECSVHIDALLAGVNCALEGREVGDELPNTHMVSALQSLNNCSVAVDAVKMVAIAQPLQQLAMQRLEDEAAFDHGELHFIGRLVQAMRARLHSLVSRTGVEQSIGDIEHQLPEFLNSAMRKHTPTQVTGSPADNPLLAAVFEEEARELFDVLAAELSSLDSSEKVSDCQSRILNALHTLKGSARMSGYSLLAERVHDLEAQMQSAVDFNEKKNLLQNGLADVQSLLSHTEELTAKPIVKGNTTTDVLSLSEATFERLLLLATENSVSQARLGENLSQLREACRNLESGADRLQRLREQSLDVDSPAVQEMLDDLENARQAIAVGLRSAETEQLQGSRTASALQQSLIRTQLMHLGDCQSRLQRVISDAARSERKQVQFHCVGTELTLDRSLYRRLLAPLEHLVRNAVVHGIEAADRRHINGKDTKGRVSLHGQIDGTELVLNVTDDGAGVDRKQIDRQRAQDGLPAVDSAQGLRDALCETGFSTSTGINQLAGRGLGLAAVAQVVEELGGTLSIASRPGKGTSVVLRVPQTVVVDQVVLIEHRQHLLGIPVSCVQEVRPADTLPAAGRRGQYTRWSSDKELDVLSLSTILGESASHAFQPGGYADSAGDSQHVMVSIAGQSFGIGVKKVVGYREIIAQPLGPQLANLQLYSGGSVLADGNHVLILDMHRLVRHKALTSVTQDNKDRDPPLALIVDDSITMRVAAEQILEHRGLRTMMARDGTEALELLRHRLPDVVLVDIDMPTMNGFDFLRHFRLMHTDHDVPIIMISSRSGEKERARAAALGVSSFLSKPYADSELHTALLGSGLRLPDISIA